MEKYIPKLGDIVSISPNPAPGCYNETFNGLAAKIMRSEPSSDGRYMINVEKYGGPYWVDYCQLTLVKPSIVTVDSIRESLLNRIAGLELTDPRRSIVCDILNEDF